MSFPIPRRSGAGTLVIMRIAIDIRRMYEFGLATYIRNVVRTLGRVDSVNEYFLVGSAPRFEQLGGLPENFHFLPLQNPEATFANYVEMHRVIHTLEVDLIHVPHTFWRPLITKAPFVITVHDLLDYMYRARTNNGMRRTIHYLHDAAGDASRGADLCRLKLYQARREPLLRRRGRKRSRWFTTRSMRVFSAATPPPAEQAMVRGRYQVDSPFLLYAGRISPHKNVARIIEAFSGTQGRTGQGGHVSGSEADHHRR